jgi:catalase (peroxidase I)
LGSESAGAARQVLQTLEGIQKDVQSALRRQEGLARRSDRAGGCAGVEQAAKNAGST